MEIQSLGGLRRRFQPPSLTLLAGLAAALLSWLFIQLGSEMAEGETRGFDMAILRAMQGLRDTRPWVAAPADLAAARAHRGERWHG